MSLVNTVDLADIGPGFANPVHAAQQVFRVVLDAVARPGRILTVEADSPSPPGVGHAANAVLLALLDQDTTLYVSPNISEAAARHFRFHTGCRVTPRIEDADFIILAAGDAWPGSTALKLGSEFSPEQGATVVREVSGFDNGLPLVLTGPGIADTQALQSPALDGDFVADWQRLRGQFPRGVDLILCCGATLVGLPRSTRIRTVTEVACT